MAISGLARRNGLSRLQIAVRMQQSANPCAQCIEPPVPQPPEEEEVRLKSVVLTGFFQVREQALQQANASSKGGS
jgi:hypothetical protein